MTETRHATAIATVRDSWPDLVRLANDLSFMFGEAGFPVHDGVKLAATVDAADYTHLGCYTVLDNNLEEAGKDLAGLAKELNAAVKAHELGDHKYTAASLGALLNPAQTVISRQDHDADRARSAHFDEAIAAIGLVRWIDPAVPRP